MLAFGLGVRRYQVAATLLSLSKFRAEPELCLHHAVTILGCVALLHRDHCAGAGALFTAFTEWGSAMHNVMSLHNTSETRALRVLTDVLTRGAGVALIAWELPVAHARGLPLYQQVWTVVGGAVWFGLNMLWTKHVLFGLLGLSKKKKKCDDADDADPPPPQHKKKVRRDTPWPVKKAQ